jgi:hypothetical protein
MQHLRLLRRSFLAGVGTTALGTMLRPIMAHAATGVAPQRLLLIHHPCGSSSLANGRWWPTGGTTGWTASPLLSSFTDGKIASLQNSMVVLKGVTNPRNQFWLGDAHGSGFLGMMTPPVKDIGPSSWPQSASATPSTKADPNSKTITASDQSIDQLFLSQIPVLQGAPCPFPSVQLTASTESSNQADDLHALKVTSYAKGLDGSQPTPLWPESSPAAAFANYFASGVMNMSATQMAQATAQNKSVLDFALGGLSNLQTQVPASQLPKVQTHISAIRQLEASLVALAAGPVCTPPSFPGGPLSPDPANFSGSSGQGGVANVGSLNQQTYPMWEQHKEIIKTLFMCDLTRVISFTFAYGNSQIQFMPPGVLSNSALTGYVDPSGNPISDPDGHHDISHLQGGTDAVNAQYIIDKYYCDRTAELLAEMSTTPDIGGGSLLDNTLVVYWTEVSDGNAHGAVDMPLVVFGGKFLKLNGGSYLQLGNASTNAQFSPTGKYTKGPPPYVSDFWVTTAQAWGYNALTAYGDPSWNTGTISGIYG